MSGYDRWNNYVFSLWRNTGSDEADVMLFGKLFHSVGPAVENERSPTVTRRVGVVYGRRDDQWATIEDDVIAVGQTYIEEQCREELARQWPSAWTEFAQMRVSQWQLARVSVIRAERIEDY